MRTLFLIVLVFFSFQTFAQKVLDNIKSEVSREEIETHIRFLASDALLGRESGTYGNDVAAAYIAAYLQAVGVQALAGNDTSFFQTLTLYHIKPSKTGKISIGQLSFDMKETVASDYTTNTDLNSPVAFGNFGNSEDLENMDVRGKVVLLIPENEGGNYRSALSPSSIRKKVMTLQEAGAEAVVFMWNLDALPWPRIYNWFSRDQLVSTAPDTTMIPYFFIDGTNEASLSKLKNMTGENAVITYTGAKVDKMTSHNVIGYIEGSDPDLRDEYVILGAHFDHVGGEFTTTGEDRIFNGARDNAVGTAAVMMAGDYFSKFKPKRSVIFAAWTAEEKGLIGSRFFIENSPVPLNKIVYNLNIDNAGYTDTTKVTVVGLERTLAEQAIKDASFAFGLEAISNPSPEQNLFDRSDNVNFAQIGIPAPTYSMGFTSFGDELFKYYHNVEDEVETLNFNYVTSYIQGYIFSARKIADGETQIFWVEGDKYEDSGKKLYGKE